MNSLRFYFDHSLTGYFYRRAREKWSTRKLSKGEVINYHGVVLQLDGMAGTMRNHIASGTYEASELSLLRTLVCPGDRIVEIGAAIGFIGLFCQKVLNADMVTSIEPNPRTLTLLRRNYDLNGLAPAVIPAALAAQDGPLPLFVSDMFWVDSVLARDEAEPLSVEGMTFSTLLQRIPSDFNTLIIDVEGAEQFLPCDSIPECVVKLLIELHPAVLGTKAAYAVLEKLIRAGFSIIGSAQDTWALRRDC